MDLTNIPSEPGVYKITNIITGKTYVGSSINLKRRAKQHIVCYKSQKSLLYEDIRIFGIEYFSFEVIELLKLTNLLLEREYFWITKLQSEYNTRFKNFVLNTDSEVCWFYTATDVSRMLNIGMSDVCDLIMDEKIKYVTIHTTIRIPKYHFNRYLKKQELAKNQQLI
jgi:excinuclease UvrABC nuclease subunit